MSSATGVSIHRAHDGPDSGKGETGTIDAVEFYLIYIFSFANMQIFHCYLRTWSNVWNTRITRWRDLISNIGVSTAANWLHVR